MKTLFFLLNLFVISYSYAQITSDRLVDWQSAGYHGTGDSGIAYTDVTAFGAVGDGVTDNHAAIVSAIASLGGQRGVIYFPPGEYLIGQTLQLPDSVILKGASSDSTFLKFDLSNTVGNCINVNGGSFSSNHVSVLSGYVRGSNFLIVNDSTVFQSGDYAELWQNNGTWDTNPVSWADNSVGQMLHIVNVSADTVFLEEAIRFNYDSILLPRIRKWDPVKEVGIECLRLERIDNPGGLSFNIFFYAALNCWVKGVESSKSISSHIEMDQSSNISISGSYIHHSFEYDGVSTHGYGITLFAHSGQCLIENNIMEHLRHSFSLQNGANGNVLAYNYSTDPNRSEVPANYGADISLHGHFPFANLFEGNVIQNVGIDQTWGPNGPLNTFLRNRVELYGIIITSGTVQSDSLNFVGNEVTNTGFLLGNYILAGTDHFQYGNMIRNVLTPAGTNALSDTSYYLTSAPLYWTSNPWPSIGPFGSASTNPAKERFLSGGTRTQCELPVINSVTELESADVIIFPNPSSNVVYIQSRTPIQEIVVSDVFGKVIKSIPAYSANETINVEELSTGFYFVSLSINGEKVISRLCVAK